MFKRTSFSPTLAIPLVNLATEKKFKEKSLAKKML